MTMRKRCLPNTGPIATPVRVRDYGEADAATYAQRVARRSRDDAAAGGRAA